MFSMFTTMGQGMALRKCIRFKNQVINARNRSCRLYYPKYRAVSFSRNQEGAIYVCHRGWSQTYLHSIGHSPLQCPHYHGLQSHDDAPICAILCWPPPLLVNELSITDDNAIGVCMLVQALCAGISIIHVIRRHVY